MLAQGNAVVEIGEQVRRCLAAKGHIDRLRGEGGGVGEHSFGSGSMVTWAAGLYWRCVLCGQSA